MPARVLFVGFDGLDSKLLGEWADAGILPTFRALLQRSSFGPTKNPPGLYGGVVWPSFNTGLSPGRNGYFYVRQIPRGEYMDADFLPAQQKGEAFWDALSRAGRRVAILDLPDAPLVAPLNGIQLVNWGTHDSTNDTCRAFPDGVIADLEKRFGRPPPDHCDRDVQIIGHKALLNGLRARVKNKLDISLHFLAREPWDFFATCFSEAHCVGHQSWHLHDPTHPRHDPALAAEIGDPLKTIYRMFDDALARLLDAAGPDAVTAVLASHGMGPLYRDESVVLDEILQRLHGASGSQAGGLFRLLKRGWYALPPALRAAPLLKEIKGKLLPSLRESMLVPGRAARRFFAIQYSPHAGAIRINVAGRESRGMVPRGDEYRRLCEELRRELLALVNAESGAPVVERVYITAENFSGPCLDDLPDIVALWRRAEEVREIYSPRIGTVKVPALNWRTGDHRDRGLFAARGAPFRPMRLSEPVSVIDIAPTLAGLLGVRLDDVEGRPLIAPMGL
ncbi:MAG TPA: alkaline phosphatase family protein [Candidatus Binatia bacterium]|nr:alkaline phosphatase family protein [Candidatus Binatia bacterium]